MRAFAIVRARSVGPVAASPIMWIFGFFRHFWGIFEIEPKQTTTKSHKIVRFSPFIEKTIPFLTTFVGVASKKYGISGNFGDFRADSGL